MLKHTDQDFANGRKVPVIPAILINSEFITNLKTKDKYFNRFINLQSLHEKSYFSRSWNIMESSRRPSKYYLYINFLAKKRLYSPSPKNSKQELSINQLISYFHQLFGSKKIVFPILENKGFSNQ